MARIVAGTVTSDRVNPDSGCDIGVLVPRRFVTRRPAAHAEVEHQQHFDETESHMDIPPAQTIHIYPFSVVDVSFVAEAGDFPVGSRRRNDWSQFAGEIRGEIHGLRWKCDLSTGLLNDLDNVQQ